MLTIEAAVQSIHWWYYAIPSAFIVLDVLTGLIKAWGAFSSVKMREGLKHKGGFLLALALCSLIDISQEVVDLGFSIPTLAAAAIYISLTEILSIFENLCEISPELAGSKLSQLILGNPKIEEPVETQTAPTGQIPVIEIEIPTPSTSTEGGK